MSDMAGPRAGDDPRPYAVDETIDIYDVKVTRDPRPYYERLRRDCPVAHSERHGGYWTVARYADVYAVAHDHVAYSNVSNGIPDRSNRECPLRPIEIDPPDHVVYRTLVNPAFSPTRMAALEPEVRAIARSLLDELVPAGIGDLAQGFALPLPAMVIARLMGVPDDELDAFSEATYRLVRAYVEGPEAAASLDGKEDLGALAVRLVAERRARPGDDVVSMLLAARVDGRLLTDAEVLGYLITLVAAGQDTTAALIGHALLYLGRHPDDRDRLQAEPGLIPSAVEELLRWESPVHVSARTTTEPTSIAGTPIDTGEMVALLWGAANSDPEEFPDADEVRLDRFPNRHLAFGTGIHRCLGSHLARLEARIAIEEVLARVPDYEVADDDEILPYNLAGLVRGIWSLPARFPGGRGTCSDHEAERTKPS